MMIDDAITAIIMTLPLHHTMARQASRQTIYLHTQYNNTHVGARLQQDLAGPLLPVPRRPVQGRLPALICTIRGWEGDCMNEWIG